MTPAKRLAVHASAVLVGEAGILIRGASGAGKSQLARELIAEARRDGRFGCLVADDRVALSARHGRLIARPVPPLAGMLEIRGLGLAPVPYEAAAVIRLVVDIAAEPIRLPEPAEWLAMIAGETLPRIVVNGPSASCVVLWRLGAQSNVSMTVP